MRRLFALIALLAVAALAQAQPSEYATLLAALKAGKTDIDYTRLRLSYMESPERKAAKDTDKAEKAMTEALNKNDYAVALKNAETVLDNEYINMDAQFVAFAANQEMGATLKAAFHRAIFRGLIDSVRSTGDGKSMEQAWVVVNVHEEYVVLRALGYTPSEQSLMHKDGHSYDVMKVKSAKDGTEQTLYFNVDIPFKHYGF
jgi:hypothetical protein